MSCYCRQNSLLHAGILHICGNGISPFSSPATSFKGSARYLLIVLLLLPLPLDFLVSRSLICGHFLLLLAANSPLLLLVLTASSIDAPSVGDSILPLVFKDFLPVGYVLLLDALLIGYVILLDTVPVVEIILLPESALFSRRISSLHLPHLHPLLVRHVPSSARLLPPLHVGTIVFLALRLQALSIQPIVFLLLFGPASVLPL